MNNENEDIKIALLSLLEEKKIEVKINGSTLTGKDALEHSFSELMNEHTQWSIITPS